MSRPGHLCRRRSGLKSGERLLDIIGAPTVAAFFQRLGLQLDGRLGVAGLELGERQRIEKHPIFVIRHFIRSLGERQC